MYQSESQQPDEEKLRSALPSAPQDPRSGYHSGPFSQQEQKQPGLTGPMDPAPDHGEYSYKGHSRLKNKAALITGGDSGIGAAVAIAFAREGADVAFSYLPEESEDAKSTTDWIQEAGSRALPLPGDARSEEFSHSIVERALDEFGRLDTLVLNAGYQKNREGLDTLPSEEMDRVFKTNLYSLMWTARAAVPHLKAGASIIVTASIQAFNPSPQLLDYAMTKAAQVAFTKALAQELGPKGIRVNAVAPGPIWTPLIPATEWPDKLPQFGQDTPLGRAGQPAELAPAYVLLASDEASYISGAVLPVTGGKGL
ncbi:SDR family oxidoreductase [Arthrobacter sp. NA-172]|uniref:SDR family oxidoreductase n=1 Tax=Arthrobacter sp. NA-172 TaxID=3367524 RepID=UPI0037542A5F